ncbi:DUF418 domain-containing protein [Pseudonocardia humida]|uniref:DUF418 domain-containing protein n=1 Tax=Pseudonocardia humida TaxID=2800819 RepID=A0ABT0ZYZ1_9PSEU|nr:DUF418 domain-containing protein [Pseudonocardia humida]MCO1655962.1 DUF418 domain-containing protein [Pseudonocardia humida]
MPAPSGGSLDPGATPLRDRIPAPDLARGGMLLLIALANVVFWAHGRPLGLRGYPPDPRGVDQVVTIAQLALVDGRAYPLFALLFGYGVVQLARRRAAVGVPAPAVVRLVRRRGWWLLLIGVAHGVLLFPGDVVGAYGLVAVLLAGALVHAAGDRALLVVVGCGATVVTVVGAAVALAPGPGTTAVLPSTALADPLAALGARAVDYLGGGLIGSVLGVFGAVALGTWTARRGLLDDPAAHRPLLVRLAVGGLGAAVLGGLPLALIAGGVWAAPFAVTAAAGALHALTGYAGGLGYAALFGLLALGRAGRDPGVVARAVRACGQRSLSCYLAQSVVFAALLPAWTLGLGAVLGPGAAALVAIGVWLVILVAAAASDRLGARGPAETLLRRLTYGSR